ncbi:hypothetical protein ACIA8M_36860 [Streptomyces anulatus]
MTSLDGKNPFERRSVSFKRFRPGDSDEEVTGPRVFIPYYVGDAGDRPQPNPFPAGVLSYWCEGIKITLPDGTPYTGGHVPRWPASTVVVDIANSGDRDAWAQVGLFWAVPTAGFAAKDLKRGPVLGSSTEMEVPAGTIVSSDPIKLLPADVAPNHMCLIAVVDELLDGPSGSWDPTQDRHYAQHNLDVVPVGAGGMGVVTFQAANPFPDMSAVIEVVVRAATTAELRTLARRLHASPSELEEAATKLVVVGQGGQDPTSELRVELGGGETRACQALVWADNLRPDEFVAIEVRTRATPLDGQQMAARNGSFGTVFYAGP